MNPRQVVADICRSLGVPLKRWYAKGRQSDVSNARSIAAYVLRLRFRMSFPTLAMHLQCTDHTSAMYHFNRCRETPWLLEEGRKRLGWMLRDQLSADLGEERAA